jgi:hypothetical protein
MCFGSYALLRGAPHQDLLDEVVAEGVLHERTDSGRNFVEQDEQRQPPSSIFFCR